MKKVSDPEFSIGIWPFKMTIRGGSEIRAMRRPLSLLVVSVGAAVSLAVILMTAKAIMLAMPGVH